MYELWPNFEQAVKIFLKYYDSFPHVFTQLRWYVPCPKKDFIHGRFYKVFDPILWFVLLLMFIVSALISVLIQKSVFVEPKLSKNTSYNLYCIWAVITSVSVPEMPQTTISRIILLMWICYSLILSTIFQSFFTSFLIQPALEKEITNIKHLYKTDLSIYSSYDIILALTTEINKDEFKEIMQNTKVKSYLSDATINPIEKFCKIEHSAMAAYDLDVKINLKAHYERGLKTCSFVHTNSISLLNFERNSPYYEAYNSKLMRYFEGGLIEQLMNRFNSSCAPSLHLLENCKNKLRLQHGEVEEYFLLSIEHLMFVFILLTCGNLISFIVFVAEIIYFKIKK
ncbi:hypothetical protein L9F63_016686 [Diploptera punctata]|uniref:Ionotropic glutamate receptor C-terminal domain-containing protein n=1 Tax=Diploptera punctata TaxID=6984 RepID=A0AAD8A0M0_DIPPU|nr:hypothetical protein L9F63_016686 [Diploptera punctata]